MSRCGTRTGYVKGCRCELCRKEHRDYQRQYDRHWRRVAYGIEEHTPPYADNSEAREHILWLRSQGVGKRVVAKHAGLSISNLDKIVKGIRTRSRQDTIARILAVGTHKAPAGSSVDAAPTWKLIDDLLAFGFTKARIAIELGATTPALQIGKRRVTRSTAERIKQVWFKLCQETEPWHGIYYDGYSRHKCRCLRCKEACRLHAIDQRARTKMS